MDFNIVFAETGKNKRKKVNQDNLYVGEGVFAVFDGLGGEWGGEIASKKAAEVTENLVEDGVKSPEDLISKVNDEFKASGVSGATTMLCASIDDGFLDIAHVGDSVAYLVRGKKVYTLVKAQNLGNVYQDLFGRHPVDCYKYESVRLFQSAREFGIDISEHWRSIQYAVDSKTKIKIDSFPRIKYEYEVDGEWVKRYSVGLHPKLCIKEGKIELEQGDIVLLATDGLIAGYKTRMFAAADFQYMLAKMPVQRAICKMFDNGLKRDDTTVIAIAYNGPEKPYVFLEKQQFLKSEMP